MIKALGTVLVLASLGVPTLTFAYCQGTPAQQRQCQAEEAQERAEAQRERAQQEAQERANQQEQARQRAQEQAQERANQEEQARQRAEQQAEQQRAREAAAQEQAARQRELEEQARQQREQTERRQQEAQSRAAQVPQTQARDTRATAPQAYDSPAVRPQTASNRAVPSEPNRATPYSEQRPTPEQRSRELPAAAHHQTDSASALREINSARANLGGINHRPIPSGEVTARASGGYTVSSAGRRYALRSNGTMASFSGSGRTAEFRPNGQPRSIHTASLDLVTNVQGHRTVTVRHADGSMVVSFNPRNGYVQRTVVQHGRALVRRTSIEAGVVKTVYLAPYNFRGVQLVEYVPNHVFVPAFYGWAFYRWPAPIAYSWGWPAAPWYASGFYGDYFAYSPRYVSAAYWLADYYLAETLAYAYQMDAQASVAGEAAEVDPTEEAVAATVTPITPELKQAIASEVEQQLAFENAASAQSGVAPAVDGLPRVLVPNHLFVVNAPLSVTTADNQTCGMSAGDVLQLVAAPADDSAAAALTVASSRTGDCPSGVQVMVTLQALQDMHNDFRAKLDAGLQTLHDSQGQNGLPAAPASALVLPPHPAEESTSADPDLLSDLAAAQQLADAAVVQVANSAVAPQGMVASQ